MRITNITPISKTLDDGNTLVANFDAELTDGVMARLTLVRSSRDGTDLVWSNKGPRGPIIRFTHDARERIATAVRAELREFAAALAAA